MTARDQLTAAHRRMTPDQIREHALELCDEIEALRTGVATLRQDNNKAGRFVVSAQEALLGHLELVYKIQGLFEAHKKREARELLRAAASTTFEPVPIPPMEVVVWSNAIFNPLSERD